MNWLTATRASAHAAVAMVITFTKYHTVEFGLQMVILFAALYLAASLGTHYLDHRFKVMSPRLGLPLIPLLVTGPLAAAAIGLGMNSTVTLRIVYGVLFAGFVIVELYLAKKFGRKTPEGRDAILTAYISLALAGLAVSFNFESKNIIGFFGAWHALLAVHLGIAAFSPKK
jgi:TRAP-type C4-dicarboxylate transport system permease small subunit